MKSTIESEERAIGSEGVEEVEFEEMEQGVSEAGMGLIMAMASLVGVWGLACLVSAIAQNGLLDVARGWLSAVTGM
jgi:hypothetical protein